MSRIVGMLALAAAIATTQAAFAEQMKPKRKAPPQAYGGVANWPGANSMAPARMIEIRPGQWVSSYGCVFEDAQGRLLDCQTSGSHSY